MRWSCSVSVRNTSGHLTKEDQREIQLAGKIIRRWRQGQTLTLKKRP